jgi:GNAT superfamily N-acetyltransferase
MEICRYEDWMKPQVAKLFHIQYGVKEEDFSTLIDRFYDLPFQKEKSIRIVAKEGDTIIGFQSFFYWPYEYQNRVLQTYQSGNSLVHPDHRGKGIFQNLLNYLEQYPEKFRIDFLVGFPVEQSKNSFIRNNWNNILNVRWHLRIINPLAFLFNANKTKAHFEQQPLQIKNTSPDKIRLSRDPDFLHWRKSYSSGEYFYHSYSDENGKVCFHLKLYERKKWMRELIIGDVVTSSDDQQLLKNALKSLIKKTRKALAVTSLTIALNEKAEAKMLQCLSSLRFIRTAKEIYFILKSTNKMEDISDPGKWILYRSDIDTW